MSSLNLTNIKTGIFNDIYIVENTGRTSIFDKFGTKTELSSLGGISTTTLTQISTAIASFSTFNSALATNTTGIANINNTLPSLVRSTTLANYALSSQLAASNAIVDYINTDYASKSYVESTTGLLNTSVSNINNTIPSLLPLTTYYNTINTILNQHYIVG